MKNKHFVFSLSLGIAIFILMILSIFLQNEVFEDLARVITIPFLIFTISIFFINISEDIITICKNKIDVEKEKANTWEYFKLKTEKELSLFDPVINPQTNSIGILKNRLVDAEKELANYYLNIEIYIKIQLSLQKNIFSQIFYLIACSLLFLSMCISPILAPYCKFVPYTTLTLLSLFLAVFELLIKNLLAQKILNKKYEKLYAKKEQNNV